MKAYKSVLVFDYDGKIKDQIPGLVDLKTALKLSREHGNLRQLEWLLQSMSEWFVDILHTDEKEDEKIHDLNVKVISLNDGELYQSHSEVELYHLPLPPAIRQNLKQYLVANAEMLNLTGDPGTDRNMLFYGENK